MKIRQNILISIFLDFQLQFYRLRLCYLYCVEWGVKLYSLTHP